jgi:hypothetical protein
MTQTAPPPVIQAGDPGDLLAFLPYALGFHPTDSLVLVELRTQPGGGSKLRVGPAARTDLPATPDPAAVAAATAFALDVITREARPGSRVLLAAYDPDAETDAGTDGVLVAGERARATLEHAAVELTRAGLDLADQLVVADGRWRSLTCDGPCCPPAGLPLPVQGRVAAEAVARGLGAALDRDAALPETAPVEADRLAVAAVLARTTSAPSPGRRRDLLARWDGEVEARTADPRAPRPSPQWCGRMLAGLRDVRVRDAVLLSAGKGPATDRARAAVLAGGTAGETFGLLRAAQAEEDRPRAAVAAGLAAEVARHAAGPDGAQAWAVAGWLEWHAGSGPRAQECCETALRADPGHRLAGLVLASVLRGLPPVPGPGAGPDAAGRQRP